MAISDVIHSPAVYERYPPAGYKNFTGQNERLITRCF